MWLLNKKRSVFEGVTAIIAIAVTLFIFTSMAFIFFKGLPYMNKAIDSKEVRFAVMLSLKTAFISTMICIILGIPTAYALTRTDLKFGRLMGIIIELPLSIPNIMLGLSLLLMFSSIPGKFLSSHGFRVIFDVKGIVLAHILVNLPFVIRIIKIAMTGCDKRLELVAGSLGAGRFRTFIFIVLPIIKNAVIGSGIIAWSRALGEFGATLMFVGATRMKTETLPVSIYLNMATGDIGPAMACAMIILIISGVSLLCSTIINNRTDL